ncbi:MAG: methyl-accepting chemotaxis protein [Leptolyngbyaceae cyanobacterium]
MASRTEFAQDYQQAQLAYVQEKYEEAAHVIDRLSQNYPDDPSVCLLRGHIYCYGLQRYDIAREQYESVLRLTADPDFTEYANHGLAHINEQHEAVSGFDNSSLDDDSFDQFDQSDLLQNFADQDFGSFSTPPLAIDDSESSWQDLQDLVIPDDQFGFHEAGIEQSGGSIVSVDNLELNADDLFGDSSFNFPSQPGVGSPVDNRFDFSDPFAQDEGGTSTQFQALDAVAPPSEAVTGDPYGDVGSEFGISLNEQAYTEALNSFSDAVAGLDTPAAEPAGIPLGPGDVALPHTSDYFSQNLFDTSLPAEPDLLNETFLDTSGQAEAPSVPRAGEDDTLFMGTTAEFGQAEQQVFAPPTHEQPDSDDFSFDALGFDARDFNSSDRLMDAETTDVDLADLGSHSTVDFLDEFDEFDDLGNLTDFGSSENLTGFDSTISDSELAIMAGGGAVTGLGVMGLVSSSGTFEDDEMFSMSSPSEQVPSFTHLDSSSTVESTVAVEQGWLAFLQNAPIATKHLYIAGVAGLASLLTAALVGYASSWSISNQLAGRVKNNQVTISDVDQVFQEQRMRDLLTPLAAGVAGFVFSFALGKVTARQIKRSTDNLQEQFNAISQGNFNARATVYSEDEFGQLSSAFNQMSRVVLTTTSEAQRKAEDQEQAKEDLQRQVIRLLDDVEGAAQGDLTVQAEVTADVLGAVADSFNLTIQNLREIVQQVKVAARQVAKGSTDNEMFARGLSSDALRQAEELAVTLNSVQAMTDSIQRVAESAGEAEHVARSASETAIKGGEAVELTVSGILQIRETVAETTRKVKRLAESSQEISKIVALISQIASRTNLLALNASIEAARAGEAGRGFAIVADEVRQLADRAAKSSKEIEQIVLQIQGETSSVMTAMEEGTQQVIEGTRLAEQAKRSLEDIIQVSNRIDVLVRSITADTVEQTETSRSVAQVMQSVELTAQETSQEAQRVSGSLQNLVSVARDLLTSVERFRVERVEPK